MSADGAAVRGAVRVRTRVGVRSRRTAILGGTFLAILSFIGLFPYLFMLVTSFKSNQQFVDSYWVPAFPLHVANYVDAWTQISPYMVTTVIVCVATLFGTLLLSSIAAFVFSRISFIGKTFLFNVIACLLMVPYMATLIPLFILVKDFGLLNSRLVLVIPQLTGNIVLATVVLKTYADKIEKELFEAAMIDGAGGIRMYRSVMLPMLVPAIGTVTLVTVINVWNDFFWPLLTVTDNNLRSISAGLSFFQGQRLTNWGPLFAGYTLSSLPLLVVFAFLSKYLLAGFPGGSAPDRS